MKEYITDMCAFYKKHGKFITKSLAIFYGISAILYILVKYQDQIQYRLFQAITWINGKVHPVHPSKEIEVSSGGLDPEEDAE